MSMYADDIREKFGRFRILIVGRANAGKTTILQRICNATEAPEIFDDQGNKIDPSHVEASLERGVHDIEHEMIFKSNDSFVFHDSQGFEAGREDEFVKMKAFVADRADTTFLKKRLHVIWYCIPMDDYVRGVTRAEEKFFGECDAGNVPVVVLFTKFDALLPIALGELGPDARRIHPGQRLSMAKALVGQIFQEADIWGRICQLEHVPNGYVCLEDMHKSNEGCTVLLEGTTATLNDEALEMLLVSAQEVNLMLCIKYAIDRALLPCVAAAHGITFSDLDQKVLAYNIAKWFPQITVSH